MAYGMRCSFPMGPGGHLCAVPWEDQMRTGAGISYLSDAWQYSSLAGFSGSISDAISHAAAIAKDLDAGTWTLARAENDVDMGCALVELKPAAGFVPMIDSQLSSATAASVMTPEESAAYERGEYELPPHMPSESLKIYIDDAGMAGFFWSYLWTITGVVDEDPAIAPIEEAQSIFMSRFPASNADAIPADEINVEHIELRYAYSFAKDAPGEYRLVPVYDFVGTSTYCDRDGIPMSFMTVNALDGSIYRRDRSM